MAYGETQASAHRMSEYMDDGGNSRHIHRQIDATRRAMDETLNELSTWLTPGRMLDSLLSTIRRSETGRSVVSQGAQVAGRMALRQARQHPMPAALITAGLALAAAEACSPRRSRGSAGLSNGLQEDTGAIQRASERAEDAANRARSMAREAADTVRDATQRAGQQLRTLGEQAGGAAGRAGRQIQQGARQAYDQTARAIDQYPLAACGAAIAAGILVGWALPRTRAEDQLYGGRAQQIKDEARKMGREAMDRGREIGKAAAQAAMDEAQQKAEQSQRDQIQSQPAGPV